MRTARLKPVWFQWQPPDVTAGASQGLMSWGGGDFFQGSTLPCIRCYLPPSLVDRQKHTPVKALPSHNFVGGR